MDFNTISKFIQSVENFQDGLTMHNIVETHENVRVKEKVNI